MTIQYSCMQRDCPAIVSTSKNQKCMSVKHTRNFGFSLVFRYIHKHILFCSLQPAKSHEPLRVRWCKQKYQYSGNVVLQIERVNIRSQFLLHGRLLGLAPGPVGGTHVSLSDPGAVKGCLIRLYTWHPEEAWKDMDWTDEQAAAKLESPFQK